MTSDDAIAANALHAGLAWLERIGAPPGASAVVTVRPVAAVGYFAPGLANVRVARAIDDAGAELCDAVGPFAARALEQMDPDALAVLAAFPKLRLQVVIDPSGAELTLRLAGAERAAELMTVTVTRNVH